MYTSPQIDVQFPVVHDRSGHCMSPLLFITIKFTIPLENRTSGSKESLNWIYVPLQQRSLYHIHDIVD